MATESIPRPHNDYAHYHAHVYFGPDTPVA